MSDSLQTILQQQSSLPIDNYSDSIPHFMPLMQLGVLQVSGVDSRDFLQNLLTNDVTLLEVNQGQLTGFCNAKGRLFSLFFLIRYQDSYQLILPKEMRLILQQRLSMYVLRSKVTITDMSDDRICIGLTQAVDSPSLPHYQAIKWPDSSSRWLYLGDKTATEALLQKLQQQQWQSASEKVWQKLDIEAGLPMIFPESKEKFTPQQVNLDLIGGVSFKKGCYPGQEVVARLHYLGKPSRRMFLAEATAAVLPAIGSEIITDNGDIAGHIVRAAYKNSETIQLLISLKLTELEANLLIVPTTTITIIKTELIG